MPRVNNLDDDKPRHYCGVVAVMLDKHAPLDEKEMRSLHVRFYFAVRSVMHRGQEGSGFAARYPGELTCNRITLHGAVPKVRPEEMNELDGTMLLGHTRYGTFGHSREANFQPILLPTRFGELAVAHNGQLSNALYLKNLLRTRHYATLGEGCSDTWVIPNLIHYSSAQTLEEAIKDAISQLEGSFSLIIQSPDATWAIRDRFGIRPLFYGVNPEMGATVIASETCAHEVFRIPGGECHRIRPGEMVVFRQGQPPIHQMVLERPPEIAAAYCGFEGPYFMRPDSIDPVTMKRCALFRRRIGQYLARQDREEWPDFHPDIVVSVPNSGLDFANGYARESGCFVEAALQRNQTEAGVARSFIAPTEEQRRQLAKRKYILIPEYIEGMKVVMVDDSTVRGTTHSVLVKMMFEAKEARAKEVHVRAGFPAVRHDCFLGIDIATPEELIAYNRTPDQVAEELGATTMRYISRENFFRAYEEVRGTPFSGEPPFCLGCVDGRYPCKREDDSAVVLLDRVR